MGHLPAKELTTINLTLMACDLSITKPWFAAIEAGDAIRGERLLLDVDEAGELPFSGATSVFGFVPTGNQHPIVPS